MKLLPLICLTSLLIGCALGPTPERVGFDYPQAGLKFSPRRHVISNTLRGTVALNENAPYELLFERTRSQIEGPNVRLLTTGIVGIWDEQRRGFRPLYDEIGDVLFEADIPWDFTLTEEREIEVPWPGLSNPIVTMRVFKMEPVDDEENIEYSLTVLVEHYGNTIEFCWRDGTGSPPDDEKIEVFFYWTHGLRFSEPDVED